MAISDRAEMSEFNFHTTLKVRFDETDMLGHVSFSHYYSYFDVGLTEYLEAIGCGYAQLRAEGIELVYVESHCNNQSGALWPELLQVWTRVGNVGRTSLRFEFEVIAAADSRKVATGHIVAVVTGADLSGGIPIPKVLRRAITSFESGALPETLA